VTAPDVTETPVFPPLPGPGSRQPAAELTWYLAAQAHAYATEVSAGIAVPVPPEVARDLALAAVHALRTLIRACGDPETVRFSLPDAAAREIVTAWQDRHPETWTGFHCEALGLDRVAIERAAENGLCGPGEDGVADDTSAPEFAALAAADGREEGDAG
jgi:hypothetical protein